MDGWSNRRNKAAFSNLSSVVWTLPKSLVDLLQSFSIDYVRYREIF